MGACMTTWCAECSVCVRLCVCGGYASLTV